MPDETVQAIAESAALKLDSPEFEAVDPQCNGHHEYFTGSDLDGNPRYGWYFRRRNDWFRVEFTRVTDPSLVRELEELSE